MYSEKELRIAALRTCQQMGEDPNEPVPVGKHPNGGTLAMLRWKFYRNQLRILTAQLEAIGYVQEAQVDGTFEKLEDPAPDEDDALPSANNRIITLGGI